MGVRYGEQIWRKTIRRTTEVIVTVGETTWSATAICSHKDQFRKQTGRKEALVILFKKYPTNFSHDDRTALFRAICPGFFGQGATSKETSR